MSHQILDWDSRFLGFPVGRINDARFDSAGVRSELLELKGKGVKLAYWAALEPLSKAEAASEGGRLVDRKLTFEADLSSLSSERLPSPVTVVPYASWMSLPALEHLAVQSGEHSRFNVDPAFPHAKFIELYSLWMRNSVRRELADEVFVIPEQQTIGGMVTVQKKNGCGVIGIIAVDAEFRGRGWGEQLVRTAQRWFARQGLETGQVVTQADNIPACRLYTKCGYTLAKTEYYYHFWL